MQFEKGHWWRQIENKLKQVHRSCSFPHHVVETYTCSEYCCLRTFFNLQKVFFETFFHTFTFTVHGCFNIQKCFACFKRKHNFKVWSGTAENWCQWVKVSNRNFKLWARAAIIHRGQLWRHEKDVNISLNKLFKQIRNFIIKIIASHITAHFHVNIFVFRF